MLVKDWMSPKVFTIDAKATLQDAINLLMEHDVAMLPVLEGGNLVGIVTDRDVKHACPSDAVLLDFQNIMYHVARVEIAAIMTRNPITVPPDLTLEETAEILLENNISGAPVVNELGEIQGIITKDDLFAALISLTGLQGKGVLFGFILEDRPGSIKDVTDVIRGYGGRLVSIVSTYESAEPGYRRVNIRAYNIEREKLENLERDLQKKGKLLYTVDHREDRRMFFS